MDRLVPTALTASWGGAFNGQRRRAEMFDELVKAVEFRGVVETGTYRGATTAHLRETTGLPVRTVEVHPRYYEYARWRLRALPDVIVHQGDSRTFLRELATDPTFPHDHVFFYLDAHWSVLDDPADALPIRDELRTIAAHWAESVVMVDDFAVPDDPEYGHDVYAPGVELTIGHVSADELGSPAAFWPRAPAHSETGARRGCVVFAYGLEVTLAVDRVATLRRTP